MHQQLHSEMRALVTRHVVYFRLRILVSLVIRSLFILTFSMDLNRLRGSQHLRDYTLRQQYLR